MLCGTNRKPFILGQVPWQLLTAAPRLSLFFCEPRDNDDFRIKLNFGGWAWASYVRDDNNAAQLSSGSDTGTQSICPYVPLWEFITIENLFLITSEWWLFKWLSWEKFQWCWHDIVVLVLIDHQLIFNSVDVQIKLQPTVRGRLDFVRLYETSLHVMHETLLCKRLSSLQSGSKDHECNQRISTALDVSDRPLTRLHFLSTLTSCFGLSCLLKPVLWHVMGGYLQVQQFSLWMKL